MSAPPSAQGPFLEPEAAPRRVLLTGVGGFVGSRLAHQLLADGHDVTALRSPSTRRWRTLEIESQLSIVESDLSNLPALRERLREVRPEICIHLAWHGWAGQAAAEENLTSLSVSLELLKLMPEIGCPRFVSAGTCFEYDLSYERLVESGPLRPANIYALCKSVMFQVAEEFSKTAEVEVVAPRLFYSYGPYEDTRRVVPAIALALLRGETARVTAGVQVRDYLHVEDVASAIWTVARSAVTGPVNIASGEPVTIAEIAETIGELLGMPERIALGAVPYREGDPMRVLADASLLRDQIGWSPRYGLREGLAQTLAWWESHIGARTDGEARALPPRG